MNNPVLKVLAVLVALALVLGVGAIAGSAAVYARTRSRGALPVAKAQLVSREPGIVIASVEPDSVAAEAGVVRGDILLEIDDKALSNSSDLVGYLDELEPGDEVELVILHGDDQRTLTATLGDRNGRAYLGLLPCGGLSGALALDVAKPGVVITEVLPDTPADEAGLQEGDVLIAVDGQELDEEKGLADAIAAYEPGDTVTLQIARSGEEAREVSVQLSEHPEKDGVAYLGVRYLPFPHDERLRGLDMPFVLPEGEIEQGVIIRRVYDDSPAAGAGLEQGDVITAVDGEAVESVQALTDAIAAHQPGDTVTLSVYQSSEEEEQEIEVRLGENPDEEGKAYLGVAIGGFFQMQHLEGDERSQWFRFSVPHFQFEQLPLDELPSLPEELLRRFEFRWLPHEVAPDPALELPGEST
jgi:S1-C subfamily serine protease